MNDNNNELIELYDKLHYKHILINCLQNLVGWKSNIEYSKENRKRKDCNDKQSIQSLKYWYQSYLNGLQLLKWIS